eukprot:10573669-Lingulodinium_polyedra.AAC.1
MGRDWTGRSIFTEGVCSYEIPRSKNTIIKAVARRKPTLVESPPPTPRSLPSSSEGEGGSDSDGMTKMNLPVTVGQPRVFPSSSSDE